MAYGLETWSTNQVVTAAELTQGINANFTALFPDEETSVDWDPTLYAVGGGASVSAVDGAYYRTGARLNVWARWTISAIGSGEYYAELPFPAVGVQSGQVLGSAHFADSSASANNAVGVVLLQSGSPQQFRFAFDGGAASAVHPFSVFTGDILSIDADFPIA